MMYSTYKLNKQSDNIQSCHTPFPILNLAVVLCLILGVTLDQHIGFSEDRQGGLVSHLF